MATQTKIELPTQTIIRTFEKASASIIFKNEESKATNRRMPKLEIQVIDAYGYQRELSVNFIHEPGNSKKCYWECHAYMHPGFRAITTVKNHIAESFVARFLEQTEKYPSLLFNDHNFNSMAKSRGFVHLHNRLLLWNHELTARLLD